MQPINRTIVEKFSNQFAGNKVGFSAKEITDYFGKYSNYVKPHDHYGFKLKRSDLFIESVYQLRPKQQYYALNDLAFVIQESRYDYPSKKIRDKLLEELHCSVSPEPLGIRFSQLRETAFREDWSTAISRIDAEPASAITAGRTMLETILKTIIEERNGQPDSSGELGKLIKQAEDAIDFKRSDNQSEHQIFTGLSSIINGISSISNIAGDRHGTVFGQSIDEPFVAQLVVNSAGVIGIAFIELHLLTPIIDSGIKT